MVKGLGETQEKDQVQVSMKTEYHNDIKKNSLLHLNIKD